MQPALFDPVAFRLATIADADGFWVAGITDGEGCFLLVAKRRKGVQSHCSRVEFSLRISLRDDDAATIREIHRIMGVGVLCRTRGGRSAGVGYEGRGRGMVTWFVNRAADLPFVVAFYRKYSLRSKKRRDFDVWAEALEWYQRQKIASPLRSPSTGQRSRRSLVARRPLAGESRKQFHRVPDHVFSEMEHRVIQIRAARAYRETGS